MRVELETTNYMFSHKKKPHGRKRWAYRTNQDGYQKIEYFTGSLTELKRFINEYYYIDTPPLIVEIMP